MLSPRPRPRGYRRRQEGERPLRVPSVPAGWHGAGPQILPRPEARFAEVAALKGLGGGWPRGVLEDSGALGALRGSEDWGERRAAAASGQPLLGWWRGAEMVPWPGQLLRGPARHTRLQSGRAGLRGT